MAEGTGEPVPGQGASGRVRIRPHHVVMAVSILTAIVFALSGIVPELTDWHDDSEVSREVFGNVPTPVRVAFYTLVSLMALVVGWLTAIRVQNWERGKPDDRRIRRDNAGRRFADFRSGVWMRTLLRDAPAGVMHSMIYFGFIWLFVATVLLEVDHQLPEDAKFLHGDTYRAYAFTADLAGVVFVVGILWAIGRRYVWPPYRIRTKTKPEDAVILGTFLLIGVSGFFVEGLRIALDGRPSFEQASFVGWEVARWFRNLEPGTLQDWHRWVWGLHFVGFLVFAVTLPTTKLRHMFTSPMNMLLSDRDRPKGAMKPMPNLVAGDTELETFGAAVVEDFTWKQLLDTDACTICGRCTSVCPAHATGKPLDPRKIVLNVGQVMAATGTPPISPVVGYDRGVTVTANRVFELIHPDEIWSCTSCKACDEICPVNIEILDKILDMRRYLSLMESNFPTELGTAYRSMENSMNPWGFGQHQRAAWAEALDLDVPIVSPGDRLDHEYLYWVGCAGSFDDRNTKVTQAMAQLMLRAKVDFAILGPSELCTGDPARRSGNEYLFQMLATENVATLNGMGVRKIVTQCPHCFNTLRNEYPQLGGHYEVVHHSQFLSELVSTGRLSLVGASLDERIVFHDACYLGRHNDVYVAPRRVIGSIGGVQVVEMPRNGTRSFCCGAGGARLWMEEHLGHKRVNVERTQEALATNPDRIAVACPFCNIMLTDGVSDQGAADDVAVSDIAQILLEAIESRTVDAAARPGTITPAGGGTFRV
jgi:Fe-S oxidoreductase/nitrate reductase gamma subunit